MQYGIAIFPDKSVQDEANKWRIRYDPHYCHIPAHMTLRDPEEWGKSTLETVVRHLEQVAAAVQPFTVHFNRVSTFFPVNHVLYFALEDPAPVEKLHSTICDGPLALHEERFVFTPHVTIGQNMASDELHDIYGNLRMKELSLASTIDRFHLLYQTEQGGWTSHQSFQLGDAPPVK